MGHHLRMADSFLIHGVWEIVCEFVGVMIVKFKLLDIGTYYAKKNLETPVKISIKKKMASHRVILSPARWLARRRIQKKFRSLKKEQCE